MAGVSSFLSERVFPILRVAVLQLVLMSGIVGSLAGWLALALLVDTLHWLDIDYHGTTLRTIAPEGKVVGLLVVFAVNLGLVLGAWRLLERRRPRDMWWGTGPGWRRFLAAGFAAGVAEAVLVFAGMAAAGAVRPAWALARVPAGTLALALGWLVASVLLGPIVEEALNRGYWFQNIRRGWGTGPAVAVTSLLFGGLHLLNPNAEPLGAINIALSGATYALALVWSRSLWLPIGWHAGWNFAEFFVAGMPNSGLSPAGMGLEGSTLLLSTPSGPPCLSGAAFGMEASAVRTVLLVAAVAALAWLQRARPLHPPGGR